MSDHDLQRVLQVVGRDLQQLALHRGGLLRDLLLALGILPLALRLRPRLFRPPLLLGQGPRALLDLTLQLAPARVEAPHVQHVPEPTGQHQRGDDDREEGARLVEARPEGDKGSGRRFAPHTVAVGRVHLEGVFPRRYLRVEGGPAGAGVDPVVVEPDEAVLETHALRGQEAERGEA